MTPFARFAAPALILALAAGCQQFPQLDAVRSDAAMQAPYPRLQPLPPIIEASESGNLTEATTAEINARGAALRARAAALRAARID
jgi:hypothetical protein